MSSGETVRGFAGETMLFFTTVFIVAAVAALILAFEEKPRGYVPIGTSFIVAAKAMYDARHHLEQQLYKKLCMTLLVSVVALLLVFPVVSDEVGVTFWETVKGFYGILVVASILVLILYSFRLVSLAVMWIRKRKIVRLASSGCYKEAVEVARGGWCGIFQYTNYIKHSDKLSPTVSRALSSALEVLGEDADAERVRSSGKCCR